MNLDEIRAGYIAGTVDRPTFIAAVVADHRRICGDGPRCVCMACRETREAT